MNEQAMGGERKRKRKRKKTSKGKNGGRVTGVREEGLGTVEKSGSKVPTKPQSL